MIGYILLLLAAIAVWAFLKWTKVKRYWADRGVPFEQPHPILGSLTFLQKKNPGIWVREIYERFSNSPYVGIWIFWRPGLVINSPEIARRVLVKDNDVFRNRFTGTGSFKTDPIGGLNLFVANDPFWSTMRRRLTPLFTSAKLKSLHPLYDSKVGQLEQRIENDLKNNQPIELRNVFADYATDLITVAAFGIESNAVLKGKSITRDIVNDLMAFNVLRGIEWSIIFFLPDIVNFFKFSFFPKASRKMLRKIYSAVVADRGGYNDVSKHNDMMDYLRKMKYESIQKGEEIAEDALVAQSAILLQGGFDTNAAALAFTSIELAHNQEAQEKLYQELLEAKTKLGDKEFDGGVLADLPYLNACIKETNRKYIPMGWLDRVASEDYKIDEKLTITKGTPVYVNAIGMHYDPKYFPKPYEYIPERFSPENEKKIQPFTYMPFGEGPRICIGLRFAQNTMRYALSHLILKYQFRPQPGSKTPNEYQIEKRGLLLVPGEPIHVDFVPRKQ